MRVLAGVLGALGALVALIGAGAGYATLRAKPPRVLFEAAPGWNANSGYLPVVMWHGAVGCRTRASALGERRAGARSRG